MFVDNETEMYQKAPDEFNESGEQIRSSPEWSSRLRVTILDADGWDRMNFQESWNEKITQNEFNERMIRSTVQKHSAADLMGW